jgi:hypothetical protein
MMSSKCSNVFRMCQEVNKCPVLMRRRELFAGTSVARSEVKNMPGEINFSPEERFPPAYFYQFNKKAMAKTSENIVKDYIRDRFGKLLIFDRTRCMEMFADVKVDGVEMYPPRSIKGSTTFKLRR